MSPRSSPPDAQPHGLPPALAWSGPVLAILFVFGVLALVPLASASPFARWVLGDVLTPERLLPPLGLGVLFALIGTRPLAAALLLFVLGIAGGLLAEDTLLWLLDALPRAATHLFYAGPIAFLAVGFALVAGDKSWPWLAPPATLIGGAMLMVTVRMTDPSLREPAYTLTPLLVAAWIAAAVALTLRAFPRRWFAVFARILGSWLLAIGLLYGGVGLLQKRVAPPAPPPAMPAPLPGIGERPK